VITTAAYTDVKVGDYVRSEDYPTFHEVVRVTRTIGLVNVDIAVGGLIERLPPRPYFERVEIDRGLR
jgi:hypothetical protein